MHWFTESTRPEAVTSRAVVNDWYKGFPDLDGSFAARVRSEVDVDHFQTLDELYVHHLLRQHFDDIRYEEGAFAPDFRVYARGERAANVEVLSLFQREDWSSEEKRHGRLADELDRRVRPTDGYFVEFDVEQADKEPAPRRFAEFIRARLADLPPHTDVAEAGRASSGTLPSVVYEQEGIRIRVRFRPMKAGARSKSDPEARIVGIGPMTGGWVNSAQRLKDRIAAKAGGRYEIGEVPFLVVAGLHDVFCSDDEVLDALYGCESVNVATSEATRRNDGLFQLDSVRHEGRHQRVSAVAVISHLRLWETPPADVTLFDNPYAARPWATEAITVTRRFGPIATANGYMSFDWISR